MIFAYLLFLIILVAVTSVYAVETNKKPLRFAYGVGSGAFAAAAIASYFAVYFTLRGSKVFDGVFLSTFAAPLVSAGIIGVLAVLIKLTVLKKRSTLFEDRRYALACWLYMIVVPILLPIISIKVSYGDEETEKLYVSLPAMLINMLKQGEKIEHVLMYAVPFIFIPLTALAINFIVKNASYIWANIIMMSAHAVGLYNVSALWDSSRWSGDEIESLVKSYLSMDDSVLLLSCHDVSSHALLSNSITSEYYLKLLEKFDEMELLTISSVEAFSGLGYNLIMLAPVILCAWLTIAKYYYSFEEKK